MKVTKTLIESICYLCSNIFNIMSSEFKLDSIESAIEDIKAGKLIIVVDDEDRENEGDFLAAAEKVTPEMINFMATVGRGLICVPLLPERCDELNLGMMVSSNDSVHETPFTISVDLKGHGTTTGISASDRSKTVIALIDKNTNPTDLARPGHIFPLKAQKEGVLKRAGHTEAAVDLARLAGLQPVGCIVEILKEDGEMARLPQLFELAKKHDLKIVSIEDLIKYRIKNESFIQREISVNMPTAFGDFEMLAYTQNSDGTQHLAITKGQWEKDEPVLVRVHSSCMTGDIFGSCRCDCGEQLHQAMKMIEEEGKGIILYMNQEGRGIGLLNKLKTYKLQEQGLDTVDANIELGFKPDERDYGIGAQILRDLGVSKMRLLSNNPKKRTGLIGYGLEIVENISIITEPNSHNKLYLSTKREKMGHEI